MSKTDMLGKVVLRLAWFIGSQGEDVLGMFFDLLSKIKAEREISGSGQPETIIPELKRFLRREPCWPRPDSVIQVDRTIRPTYPLSVEAVVHNELEKTGPEIYDIAQVYQQKRYPGFDRGLFLFNQIMNSNYSQSCLNLQDLEEIQKKGPDFFKRYFDNKEIFAWKSVCKCKSGDLKVPSLTLIVNVLSIEWQSLNNSFPSGVVWQFIEKP